MKNKLTIIRHKFEPNTAVSNRFLAFSKGYAEQGYNIEVVFLANNNNQKVPYTIEKVNFRYLYEEVHFKNKYLNLLCTLVKLFNKFHKGENVILYGAPELLFFFSLVKKINLYHEITESPEFVKITNKFFHALYIYSTKHIDGLFVISKGIKQYFVNKGVEEKRIHIINMIVDFSRFENVKIINKEKYIGYCGTVSYYKDGVDMLIKAFDIFSKQHLEYKLYIIGEAENESVNKKLIALTTSLNLQDRVIFTGKVNSDLIPELLGNAQILALARPNNIQAMNGFPTKLGEYLCTAKPVVITRTGDIDSFLENNISCIFAEPDNIEDFAKQLNWVVENYDKAHEIGRNGKMIALNDFSYKIESSKVLKILNMRV